MLIENESSTPSSLNLRVGLSRFFCLAKRGDRGKHSNVSEIERKARREKIDENTLRFKLDGALVYHCGPCYIFSLPIFVQDACIMWHGIEVLETDFMVKEGKSRRKNQTEMIRSYQFDSNW